jgi:plasmid stabilization system protein ParE
VKYKVIVLPGAKAEFHQIHGYLKERFGKRSATRFKTTFTQILKALRHTPRMYEAIPERYGAHKCSAMSPTLVLYEVLEKEKRVEILTLYDGRYETD